jgi:hypothetical protein
MLHAAQPAGHWGTAVRRRPGIPDGPELATQAPAPEDPAGEEKPEGQGVQVTAPGSLYVLSQIVSVDAARL